MIFTHSMKSLAAVDRFQVVQRTPGRVEIYFTARQEIGAGALKGVCDRITSGVGREFEVGFERVSRIEASPSGKYRWIRSELQN